MLTVSFSLRDRQLSELLHRLARHRPDVPAVWRRVLYVLQCVLPSIPALPFIIIVADQLSLSLSISSFVKQRTTAPTPMSTRTMVSTYT